MNRIIIQLICPDQKGIIAQLTTLIYNTDTNILSIEQHVDNNKFYIRILVENNSTKNILSLLEDKLNNLNKKLNGELFLYNPNSKTNVAILGTKESEPIYDLLIKNKSNEIKCNISVIISNHNKLKEVAEQFKTKFLFIKNNKELINVLNKNKIDLIILARYMQIIPDAVVKKFKNKIINIHHGFLPAFKGAKPYKQAFDKGVKIIGATAHYVTEELDEGPIICQDVIPVNHMHSSYDMMQLGREIERNVLYKAVKSHLECKIVVTNNKTIVFK